MIDQELIDSTPKKIKLGFDENLHDWITKEYQALESIQVPLLDEFGNPTFDEEGNQVFETQTHEVTKINIVGYTAKQVTAPTLPVFNVLSPVITVGGSVVTPVNGFYYVQQGVPIEISTTASLEGGEAITLPPPLAMPVVMFDANQQPSIKRYASTSVTSGVVSASITIEESGAWKIREDFVNESLAEVGQPWRVSMDTITFLVM